MKQIKLLIFIAIIATNSNAQTQRCLSNFYPLNVGDSILYNAYTYSRTVGGGYPPYSHSWVHVRKVVKDTIFANDPYTYKVISGTLGSDSQYQRFDASTCTIKDNNGHILYSLSDPVVVYLPGDYYGPWACEAKTDSTMRFRTGQPGYSKEYILKKFVGLFYYGSSYGNHTGSGYTHYSFNHAFIKPNLIIDSDLTIDSTLFTDSTFFKSSILIKDSPSKICPNPVTNNFKITFSLGSQSKVLISMYDIWGKKVMQHYSDYQIPANYSLPIDVSNLESGIYFLRLEKEGKCETLRCVIRRQR